MTSEHSAIDCKFTGRIERDRDRYVVEIPQTEIEFGTLAEGNICQIGITTAGDEHQQVSRSRDDSRPEPPVSVGERRTVEIEDMGDQGDGIARVDRGYVLIVPETDIGDEVTVEIQATNPNYGFAATIEEGNSTERDFEPSKRNTAHLRPLSQKQDLEAALDDLHDDVDRID